MMKETEIDVTLVAGRRPELLRRTLASFQEMYFGNFHIGNAFVNIDPWGGNAEDADTCKDIVLEHFPSADVIQPDKASYGQAVKTLWSMIRSPYALHLEDDWLALEAIHPERIFPLFSSRTRMVSFMAREKNWNGRTKWSVVRRRIPYTPIKIRHPRFSVSPCFVDGPFAHGYAKLIDPELDPEKQSLGRHNPPLVKYVSRFRCAYLISDRKGEIHVIRDIGREWRMIQGIEKTIHMGRSIWSETPDRPTGGHPPSV